MRTILAFCVALLLAGQSWGQKMKFDHDVLHFPERNAARLEQQFQIAEQPKLAPSPAADLAVLENGYAQSAIRSPEQWARLMDSRQAVEVTVVYTKYPPDTEAWGINYHALLAQRLKALFDIDPALNDDRVRWKIVMQTDCASEAAARTLFHGILVRHVPRTEPRQVMLRVNGGWSTYAQDHADGPPPPRVDPPVVTRPTEPARPAANPTEQAIVEFIEQNGGQADKTVYNVFERNTQWRDVLVVMDWTASMYQHGSQAVLWHQRNLQRSGIKYLAFFNDGDRTNDARKQVGSTGGIYFAQVSDMAGVLSTFRAVQQAGGGGDTRENDIEALLKATEHFSGFRDVVLIADNPACVRDIELVSKLRHPVHVILCGYTPAQGVNPQYANLAFQTGGSLHTLEQDLARVADGLSSSFAELGSPAPGKLTMGRHPCGSVTDALASIERAEADRDRAEIALLSHLRKFSEFFGYEDLTRVPILKLEDAVNRPHMAYVLRARKQGLDHVPPAIEQMENLQALFLDQNRIDELPEFLAKLKYLQYMNLSANNLASLPAWVGDFKELEILRLADNQLTSLPPEVAKMRNLLLLDLRGNPLTSSAKTYISLWLPKTRVLYD